jgi:hypothetical protein
MQIINKLLLLLLILCVSCKKELSSDSGSIGNQQVKVYDFKLANAKDCSDGGYILATTNSLVKLTSDGQVSWMKKYTDYNIDTITFKYSGGGNVIQNADGGFSLMISGIFKKVDNSYFCIVKTDQFGNKIDILKFYFPFSKQVLYHTTMHII